MLGKERREHIEGKGHDALSQRLGNAHGYELEQVGCPRTHHSDAEIALPSGAMRLGIFAFPMLSGLKSMLCLHMAYCFRSALTTVHAYNIMRHMVDVNTRKTCVNKGVTFVYAEYRQAYREPAESKR